MEQRKINMMINKTGGNSGANSVNYRVCIPSTWAKEMGITPDDKGLIIYFDGNKIIIEKSPSQ